MKFLEMIHHFDRPWNVVTFAAWNKYPNDNSPQVLNVDILNRSVNPETGVLHTERLLTCRQNLPSILEWVRQAAQCCLAPPRVCRNELTPNPVFLFALVLVLPSLSLSDGTRCATCARSPRSTRRRSAW